MAKKADKQEKLTPEITISEIFPGHPDSGFWLYDSDAGINLAMRADSERQSLLAALTYWKSRFQQLERVHSDMAKEVNRFITIFKPDEED